MKEKYDVPIAPESEFVSYMMEQMTKFGLPCTEEQAKDFYVYYARMIETNKYLNLTGITDMKEVVVKHRSTPSPAMTLILLNPACLSSMLALALVSLVFR